MGGKSARNIASGFPNANTASINASAINGISPDTHSGSPPGFGLRGLRERAGQLGGGLCLEPRPLGGSQLSVRLPLGPPETGEPAANTAARQC